MNRQLTWKSGWLDEMELVYEKAAENAPLLSQLEQLETLALSEAKTHCGALTTKAGPLTPERFDRLSAARREEVICALGAQGLAALEADPAEAAIHVRFAPFLPSVMGCTIFNLLNRLEKLDGAFHPLCGDKATLNLQVPLGGKKGLFQWELLIMQLYPWLSVHESASRVAAVPLSAQPPARSRTPSAPPQADPAPNKQSLWRRLFGGAK